jgi:hypothetical protein
VTNKSNSFYKRTTFLLPLLFLSLALIFTVSVNNVSATPINTIYVNGSSGNDTYDGSTWLLAKKTIKNATDNVNTNGTVNIANGQYTGINNTEITINKNMNIQGQSETGTIINGTGTNWIFNIQPGITVTISNLTLTNGTTTDSGGAIYNDGNLTVTNTTFTSNTAINSGNGEGGAIFNTGTLNVTGSNFNSNAVTLDGFGGAISNFGTLIVTNTNFTDNTAPLGGAIANFDGTANVQFNRFIGNTAQYGGSVIYFYSSIRGSVIATDNWWGSNSNPSNQIISDINFLSPAIPVSYDPWIVLTITANPKTIGPFDSSTITADLLHDSSNGYHDPLNGHIPDGIPAIILGVTSSPYVNTINGTATATYTNQGLSFGHAIVIANVDSQTVETTVEIKDPTTITVDPIHNYPGQSVNLTANVNDYYNNPVNGGKVTFTVGSEIPVTVSVVYGVATLANWTIPNNWNVRTYTITATYDGIGTNYANSTNSSTLTIDSTPTNITVKNVTGIDNQTVTLNATLTDTYGNLLASQTVFFSINGHNYSAITNNNGIATINYIPYGAGNYDVTVNYLGNDNYTASEGSGLLNMNPSAYLYLQITSSNKKTKVGETFTITYKLGNKGPDNATNVTMSIPLPSGFNVSNVTGNGNWTYNPTTNTIIWTLSNVPVGDPYLYVTGKTDTSGLYVFGSNITSETYNLNTGGVDPITINATNPTNPTTPTSKTILNAATSKIPMQHTGVPIAGLILAILTVIGGSIIPRLKK